MLRHFDETPRGWQVRREVQDMVRFAQGNLLTAPHPARLPFDLVLCRNVLLYFDRQVRSEAFERLSRAVMPDGFLMLGAGETVVGQTDRFVPTQRRASFFELAPASSPAAAMARKIA
jgi:chemotaxis protein methyltransferase CheR